VNAPGPGYAVITGVESGVFVVDIDVKSGVDGYEQLEALDELPETLTVRTGSGGAHFYFKHPGFHVSNRKLASAIDIKADKDREDGLVYVVGPGSPGYVKTDDPCVAMPGDPYEVTLDVPIADAPEWLLSWFRIGETRKEGFAPEAITPEHPDWNYRIGLATEACKTMPPSRADGEGGKRLFAICLRLVRAFELPLEKAYELISEHFNPRCTQPDGTTPYPWSDDDLIHKLEDVRDRSNVPTGILSQKTEEGLTALKARLGNPNRTPIAPPPAPVEKAKDKVGADRAYDGERVKITRTALTQMLFNWPDWKDVFWYDVLSEKPRATNPPLAGKLTLERGELSKGDFALIAHWLDVKGFLASKEMIEDALWTVVRSPERQRNVIAEYFDSLEPATEAKILPTLATDIMGSKDAFSNTLVMKTLVAAARRARQPGAFHKSMLVLKGLQRCGKTPFVKILAGPWYQTTGNGNLADRDTILECQGKLLVEVEELSALGKSDADALKTAISRTHDPITKKYEPDGRNYARSFMLIGTTNKDEFLTDATGNARYWVVEVGEIDLARLAELRDVIWAEADFLACSGYSTELEKGAESETLDEQNKVYLNTHPWLDDVAKYLGGKKEVSSASEVLMHILKGDTTKADKRLKNEVADLMRTLGCVNGTKRAADGKKVRCWTVPDGLPARASSVRASLTRVK
jgi:predicted P-loop ATPase